MRPSPYSPPSRVITLGWINPNFLTNIYENVWLNNLKCISIFELKCFYENDCTLYLLLIRMIENI